LQWPRRQEEGIQGALRIGKSRFVVAPIKITIRKRVLGFDYLVFGPLTPLLKDSDFALGLSHNSALLRISGSNQQD
jgi:hypothetical protein